MFDVLVIGGGPAGSSAAYHLASRGINVAVVDQSAFPREKACGDMLSRPALDCLERLGLSDWVATYAPRAVWPARFGTPVGRVLARDVHTRDGKGRFRWVAIPRCDLDAALLAQAQRAGASVFERVAARGLHVQTNGVEVKAAGIEHGALGARLAIIAEGSSGRHARRTARTDLFALRGYFVGPVDEGLILQWDARLAPGYLWQFPLPASGSYNIGLGTSLALAHRLRPDRYLLGSEVLRGKHAVGQLRGGLVNASFNRKAIAHGERVLWAGDAAGLVQPHLGEGIYPALQSGEIAAESAIGLLASDKLSSTDLALYSRRLHEVFDHELSLSRLLQSCATQPRLLDAIAGLIMTYHGYFFHQVSRRRVRHAQPVSP